MSDWQVLPPGSGKCRSCAVEHDDSQPHDATSLYYQVLFANTHGQSATWADAIAHCEPEVKKAWTECLNSIGIDINSTQVKGGIKSKEELNERLANTSNEGTVTGGEG